MGGRIFFAVLCMLGFSHCAIDNAGTEFVICYMDNLKNPTSVDVELYITTVSNNVVQVNITTPLYNSTWREELTVTRGSIKSLTIPATIRGVGVALENKAIYITATDEVTVYGVNKEQYSTDAFIAYPVDSLGSDYVAVSWTTYTEIMVAAVTDGTIVTFEISTDYTSSFLYDGDTYSAGSTLTVTLNRFQTFHIYSVSGDMTGTRITSTNPISAFSGNKKTTVLDTNTKTSGDHLVEQLVATQSWGKEFISFPMPARTIGDYIRVVAEKDNSSYSYDGVTYTLDRNRYQTHNAPSDSYFWISANKGICVVMIGKTEGKDGYNDALRGGDPAMSLVVPAALYGSDYTWSTVTTTAGEFNNTIVVVSHANYTSDIVLDDESVNTTWTTVIGNANYVATYFNVTPGAHTIYNRAPAHGFLGMAMGNAKFNSYAYASGLRLAPINLPCNATATVAGDGVDNDCDGRIDEETANGVDDDDDGDIDEDLALSPRVNGGWGNWTEWNTCSNTCGSGSGTYSRTRACDSPAPANNGLDCEGSTSETGNCTGPSTPCPINGGLGQWSNWTVCSVTCGSGLQLRTRVCDSPPPQYGGLNCTGDLSENTGCNISSYCLPAFYGNPLKGCPSGTFGCATGSIQCIDIAFRCDGQKDCDDETDESPFYTGCALSTCFQKSGAGLLQSSVVMVMMTSLLIAFVKRQY